MLLTEINKTYHVPTADYQSTLRLSPNEHGVIDERLPYRNLQEQLDIEYHYDSNMIDYIAEARQRGERWLHLVYEDDIEQSPKVAYEKVCEFLGVKAIEVEYRLQRLNPQPLSEIIENFDEVREYLSGTRYEAMLEG